MKRASLTLATLIATSIAGLAASAHAQPSVEPPPSTVTVTPPTGWTLDVGRTAGQAKALRDGSHLGDGGVRAAAAFYRSSPPGGVLIVSELVAEPAPADPIAAARAELVSVRSVVEAVDGTLVGWRFQGGEPTLPEARLEWKDASVGTTSITRAMVFRTAGALMVVTAECVLAGDADALRAPCEAALAQVQPLASLTRVEVGLGATDPVTAATRPAADPPTGEPTAPGERPAATTSSTDGPRMTEGGPDLPATILVRPPASKTDRRPILLAAGIGVLALVFLWNRRQRARLEAAEERERRREERKRPKAASGDERDDDGGADDEDRAEADASARAAAPAATTDDETDDEADDGPDADDEAKAAGREARDGDGGDGKERA